MRVQETNTCHTYGPRKLPGSFDCLPVVSLHRTTIEDVVSALLATDPGRRAHGGCCCAFRVSPPHTEPFGMWFAYFVAAQSQSVVFVDLQNSLLRENSLRAMIDALDWAEPARPEVFFAPFR